MGLADVVRAVWDDGTHVYISTACLHGEHEHCRSTVNAAGGPKTPGTCKWCSAVCQCAVCSHTAPEPTPARADRPVIRVDPGMRWGYPHLGGVGTDAIAGMVMAGENLTAVADDYNTSVHGVLLACWFEGTHGHYQAEWGDWATGVYERLAARSVDVAGIEGPPDRDELGLPPPD